MAARDALKILLRRVLPALAVAALLLASLKLAEEAAGDNARFASHYRLVLGAALLALAVLVLVIGTRLLRLRADVRRGAPGARLNRRLLGLMIALALPASLIVYGFSLRFLDATIDNWFNVRLEQALDDALELGRLVIDEHLQAAESATAGLAGRIAETPTADPQQILDDRIEATGAIQLALLGVDSRVQALASSDPRWLEPPLPDSALLLRVRGDHRYAAAEPLGDGLMLRVVLPIEDARVAPERQRLLQALFPLPAQVQPLMRGIESASFDFQRLKFLRGSLKLTFALILTFVLLLSALAVVLVAFVLTRRLVAPISRLSAATRAVAAGRFDTPLPATSDDELGFLVRSFAQMTRDLELAGARAQRSTREIEQQRAWLEAVLERLSAGVLGFDHEAHLRSVNPAAEAILGVPLTHQLGASAAEIGKAHGQLAPFVEPLGRHLREQAREWREEVVLDSPLGPRTLMVRGAALPGHAGFVAVFDDLTVLNRAQRDAAWGEVARRLAHEVKNPLTPIQLAAERLRRRFLGRLPPDDGELIDRATQTIVSQVEALKTMVNAFGDYARPPPMTTHPIALNALVNEVLDLYENDQRLGLTRQLDAGDPRVRGDAVRLRQALHNLIKNALEAIGDAHKAQLVVATRSLEREGETWVELAVADNGPGLPADFGERWYEPYTSSKQRGTGLGLAVVKKIAEEHGGSVRAANRESGGAQFIVVLPAL